MKYLLETYGCQLNTAESNALELILKGRGLENTEIPEEADAVIINTCSVRKSAENRIWGRLGFYSRLKKDKGLKIIVTGCMAERMKDELLKEAPYVDAVIGTNDKSGIADLLTNSNIKEHDKYTFLTSYYKEGEFSSYVPIMNGCNNFCSYCIVPYVRGREISREVEDILNEIKALDKRGVREVTLLGQNVNSYKSIYNDRTIDFPTLLELILPCLNSIEWIRFESPHPKDFSDHLIDVIGKNKRISSHIHLPMQSGSSRILKLMNRKTTREEFIALLDRMREGIPDLTLATDVMVGFPTESEEEYQDTLSMMDIMNCTEAFMYYFNPREGTKAAAMEGQIEQEVKNRRLERLIELQLKRQKIQKESKVPFIAKAIVIGKSKDDEDRYLCRTEHNDYISTLTDKVHEKGDVIYSKALEVSGNTFRGVEVEGL